MSSSRDSSRVVAALERLGGPGRSTSLAVPRRLLDRAVAGGDVLRAARGVFALPTCPDDVLVAVPCNGVLSCLSAARSHGLPVIGEPPVHVTAPQDPR